MGAARPHNLPAHPVALIGRDQEAREVRQRLLGAERGLLTLTGAGGCGKTSLALHVARDVLDAFRDGVWLVELAALAEPTLVPQAVASVLGVREGAGRPILDSLLTFFESRALLLVLDNCEHLGDASAQLVEGLLSACPELHILATSREPLRIGGEVTWRVPSLGVPDPKRLPPLEELAAVPAVRLFVERAQAVRSDFALTPDNAAAVAQICARLEGLPLALELAAARMSALAAEQIAERLGDSFHLLTGGSRTAPTRQQTLRATLDWSRGLLTAQEQAVFRRLAVFAGGWSLEAAEAVCAANEVERSDVLDLLTRLVDKSLVLAEEHGGQARYRLLEPVRQYARERLKLGGDEQEAQRRHAAFYLALVPDPTRHERRSVVDIDPLEREQGNLRGALAWAEERGDAEAILRLTLALSGFWFFRGYLGEGRRWVAVALAQSGAAPAALRAKALNAAGIMAYSGGDYERAAALYEECVDQHRVAEDTWGTAWALHVLGVVVGYQGDFAAARRRFDEALALYRGLGDTWGVGTVLSTFGKVVRFQGELAEARTLLEESLPLLPPTLDTVHIAETLVELGGLALERDDAAQATALGSDALRRLQAAQMWWYLPECLELLAEVASAGGEPARAARLFGAAEAARVTTGTTRPPGHRAAYARQLAATHAALDEASFLAAWAEGRAMTMDRAVSDALAAEALTSPVDRAPEAAAADRPADPLTPREREVAVLLARGLTDREIGERLVITRGTAGSHVVHILDKLGFRSRAQVAAWAAEHGLLHPATD